MKKLFVLTVIFSLISLTAQSQTWTPGTGLLYTNPTTTKVGIGTATPREALDVASGNIWLTNNGTSATNNVYLGHIYLIPWTDGISYISARRSDNSGSTQMRFRTWNNGTYNEAMTINSQGNIGIGTVTPTYKLHVNSTTNGWASMVQNQGCIVYSAYGQGTTDGYGMHIRVNNTRNDRYALQIYDGTNNLFYVRNDGNIGIGTANPDFKLTVNGNIKAEYVNIVSEVVSDYVFEKDYNLMPLTEVESFVDENKHLPEVPSAAEFKETGYSVGQMDDLLLRKVEELTLYIIEQQKQIVELKLKLEKLESVQTN